jgi:hypothetical protein
MTGRFYNNLFWTNAKQEKQEMALPVYIFSNSTMFPCFGKMFADNASLSQSLSLRFLNVGSQAWRGKSNEYYASREECKYKK